MAGISGTYQGQWRNCNDKKSGPSRRRVWSQKHEHLYVPVEVSILFWLVKDATSFLYQLKVVVQRNNIALWRSPEYIFTRLFISSFISLFVSLSFLQLGNSVRELQFRVFAMYVQSTQDRNARCSWSQILGRCSACDCNVTNRTIVCYESKWVPISYRYLWY